MYSKNNQVRQFIKLIILSTSRTAWSCFPDCWSLVVPVFNAGQMPTAQNYRYVNLLFVEKSEKRVHNRLVDHLEKLSLFSDFCYGFMPSQSTADVLINVSDRIASDFNSFGTTRAAVLGILYPGL